MEEETNAAIQECTEALQSAAKKRPGIVLCFLTSRPEHHRHYDVSVPYLTISDFYRLFPKYSRQNIVRLFALTGGIPEIVKELDAEADFDENMRRLLSYDSVFSAILPAWLSRCFRSPDSYYPILCSIADGKHRLAEIAKAVGVSEKFIAITILAGGTSLPELVTCIVAVSKKKDQLALGNILGSNVFNILLILGGSAVIRPLSFASINYVDLGVLLLSSLLLLLSAWTGRNNKVDRFDGALFLLFFAGYFTYLFMNI